MLRPLQLGDAAPWKQRFRAPTIMSARVADAAPTRGVVTSNLSGLYQLYAWDVASGTLRKLTDRPDGARFGRISPDGRYVLYLDDNKGNEIGHYVRVPFEGGAPQDVTPQLPSYSPAGLDVSYAGNLIGVTAALPGGMSLYCVDVAPDGALGVPRAVWSSPRLCHGPVLSHGGEIAVMQSTERSGRLEYSLVAVDTRSGKVSGELWDGPGSSLEAVAFSRAPGDFRLLARTNRYDVNRPVVWNTVTGERIDLPLPELEGDVSPEDWSADGTCILLMEHHRAVPHLYLYDLQRRKLSRLEHPGGTFWWASFGPGREVMAHWQDSTHPPRVIAFGLDSGAGMRTLLAGGEVPPCRPWRSVEFRSSDGVLVQAWLALPEGSGPFPAILHTHGGPEFAMSDMFNAQSQAWLDHGFAFLSVNYRGSTTFGREFQQKIWGNPGHWEVEDMVAARDWLVAQGIARPDQVLLNGWSYGGYLTLQALGTRPDLWAGGMAGVAVADWAIEFEDEAETLKAYDVALFGGTPAEVPERYAASSPLTYVENVRAPVLIIQGRNDTRCPARQVEIYEQRMRALGKPIEVHWFDAGHGSPSVEQNIQFQEAMLRFAYRVLEGPGGSPRLD